VILWRIYRERSDDAVALRVVMLWLWLSDWLMLVFFHWMKRFR
jgi:hypothetical protein